MTANAQRRRHQTQRAGSAANVVLRDMTLSDADCCVNIGRTDNILERLEVKNIAL
ncbi:MAG: hypothetical protein R2911_43110 [Caldilineaceae bacterium]